MTDRADSRLDPGTMLAHYKVQAELGSGAMGTVYLAHDTSLDRSVAVKVLHREISEDPEIVRRFEREARAAARVNHPNLTHVYFVGAEGDRRFFVMEHVPGQSLFQKVTADGPLTLEGTVDALVQAARGLGAAHAAGVIHRDVKPSNLILLPDGTLKVADFGLAKSLTGDADATGAGRVMGTPRYMSPEQCRGEAVDESTDAYALGLLAFFLLTGEHAFDGDSLGKVIHDQMNSPLRPLGSLVPGIPAAAQDVLEKLCAKKPGDRPASMAEVERLLETLRPRVLDLAPLMARGTALVIDFGIVFVAVGAAFGAAHLGGLGERTAETISAIVATILIILEQVGMEWRFGGSAGKLLFRIRVVTETGARPRIGALALRFLVRFPLLPFDLPPGLLPPALQDMKDTLFQLLGVGAVLAGVVCYFITKGRTLSDVVTRTRVVNHSPRRDQSA